MYENNAGGQTEGAAKQVDSSYVGREITAVNRKLEKLDALISAVNDKLRPVLDMRER